MLAGAALLALLVALPAIPSGAAAPALPSPAASTVFTLYGDATTGWGNTSTTISNPGPTLYVYQGTNVSITLYSQDGITHNWFIDFNGNSRVDAGENSSPVFTSRSTPTVFNFTVPTDRAGVFTYRCEFHPTAMTGQIVILTPRELTLYGKVLGWSLNGTAFHNPGPSLYVLEGVNVTLHLISSDGTNHTWFVDYNNDSSVNGNEVDSPPFYGGHPVTFTFRGTQAGTYTYRCSIHTNSMTGVIVIYGPPAPRPAGFPLGLVPSLMLATIVVVLVLAGVYQVRSVRAARRER